MPTSDSRDYDLIDRLAEEFAKRFRDGERPSIQEYCNKYPHIAEDLREMLPALAEVEQVKDEVQAPPAVEPPKFRDIGDYHILREVGRGGMGVVYEADDTRLGRRVALKVLATGKAGHALERFKREARAAARLHHTNIVPVFGVGDHEGLPYYVMQFIQGLGLDEVLDEVKRLQSKSGSAVLPSAVRSRPRKDISAVAVARSLVTGTFEPPSNGQMAETLTQAPVAVGQVSNLSDQSGQVGNLSYGSPSSSISLPGQSTLTGRKPTYWQSVAQIGLQVADALDYAHKQGILHRDIKPSNLLLDLHGVVWVTDFGLAKAADQEDLTHTGDLLGTLRYMPPEAFEGKSEARSDVYSLGLSMYELLALRPAYDERKKEQLVKQVTTTDPPRLGTINRSIPRDLQTIVHKAIEKDPDHRYKSAGDLAADLRRFLADQTILARRVSTTERFARWCKRNPTVAALTAAVFILLLSVASISSILALRIEQKAKEAQAAADRANDEAERKELALQATEKERERADKEATQTALALKATEKERERANEEAGRKTLALEEAAKERRRTEELIGEQFVHRGAVMLTEGDVAGAALCFAQALKLDPNDPERALTHRIRLAAALRDAPRPRHALFHDVRVVCAVLSPEGKFLATGCEDNTVNVWDLATGQRAGAPLQVKDPIDYVNFAANNRRLWVLTKPAPPAGANPEEPLPANASFVATLWDLQTRQAVISGKRNYYTAFNAVDPISGRGIVALNPEPTVMEMRDRDTGEPVRPPIHLPSPNTFATVSFRAHREIVVTRVAADSAVKVPRDPRAGGAGPQYEIRVFDDRTGKLIFQTPPSLSNAAHVCGTNDRFLVVTEAQTGALQWYELATGRKGPRVMPPMPPTPGTSTVTVTPDSRRLVVTVGNGARLANTPVLVLDADTGAETVPSFVSELAFQFNGRTVVPNIDASRFILPSGRARLARGDGTALADQPDLTTGEASFSPDGGFVLTVGVENMVRVWDAWTGKPVTPQLPHTGPVQTANFSPDGSHVLTVSGSVVRLWPLAQVAAGRGLRLENGSFRRALSEDGTRILECPLSSVVSKAARVIDSSTGQTVAGPVGLFQGDETVSFANQAYFRPDGRAALFLINKFEGGSRHVRGVLWNCDSGTLKELWNIQAPQSGAEFSPDGRFVRAVLTEEDARMRLWDATTGEPVGKGVIIPGLKGSTAKGVSSLFGPNRRWTWSPDSSVAAYAGLFDRTLLLCDARTGASLVTPPIAVEPLLRTELAFSDDSSRLLVTQAGLQPGMKPPDGLGPDTANGRVRLFEARSGRPIGPALTGVQLGGVIGSATLNRAGNRIAVVTVAPWGPLVSRSNRDPASALAVHLWDPAAGRLAAPPLVHDQPVRHVAFSPDGGWLLTATTRYLRVWSTATGELLRAMPTGEDINEVTFSQDGRRVVVVLSQGQGPPSLRQTSVQVWDARTGLPLTPPLRASGRTVAFGPAGQRFALSRLGDWSRNADRLLVDREDGSPEVYSLAGDDRPAAELLGLTELLSTRQVNSAGVIQGVGPAGFRPAWEAVRPKFAAEWAADPVEGAEWDRLCATRASQSGAFRPLGVQSFQLLLNQEQAAQCLWHLDRLLAADPNSATFHAQRGLCLATRDESAAAEAEYTRAIELGADGRDTLFLSRGWARAELGRWAEAEADLVELLRAPPRNLGFGLVANTTEPARAALALIRLHRGDILGYMAACARIKEDVLQSTPKEPVSGRNYASPILWPALVTEGAVSNLKDVLPDATGFEQRFEQFPGPFIVQPALRYRQGRYQEAERLSGNIYSPSRADYYFLAMAQHRLGRAEARATLEKANGMKPDIRGTSRNVGVAPFANAPAEWERRLIEEMLRAEAEELILGKK